MPEATASTAPMVRVRDLRKSFGAYQALHSVDLDIRDGEFLTLLGPSGCGKTTLMRVIAGLESSTAGTVAIKGRDVGRLPPRQRGVGMVFQSYALFPHMTVADNVGYGLRVKGLPAKEIASRVAHMLDLIRLPHVADRRPAQLSGGQQQRVALARALATKPSILMLDEPLGALDLKLRRQMQLELRRIHGETKTTFLFVTHDQEEALFLSDRVAIMREGRIEQLGTPLEVYHRPVNDYVADFVGDVTLLDCERADDSGKTATVVGLDPSLPILLREPCPAQSFKVVVRPEHVTIAGGADPGIPAVIDDVINEGSTTLLVLRAQNSIELRARVMTRPGQSWSRNAQVNALIQGAAALPDSAS